jgi:hypothetical protein
MIGIAIRPAIPRMRAYTMPAVNKITQTAATDQKYPRRLSTLAGASFRARLAVVIFFTVSICILSAQEPPPGLARKVAHRESETQAERNQYAYRQTVRLQELDSRGGMSGEYREVRDVIFSPAHERTEQMVGAPLLTLKHLILTEEDFRDIREIQPFVLTDDMMSIYESKFRGDEPIEGMDCWVLQVRPRQILDKQRLFDGMLWVKKDDYSVVRSEGQAVPQIRSTTQENLFPRFTTIRHLVNGFWFPTVTTADDTLYFRTQAQRERLTIHYSEYRKFGVESSITFEKP